MIQMKPYKLLCFLLFLVVVPAALGASVNITIGEEGKIVSFYDQYYVYQLNGSITIQNPANTTLYNIEIPLYLSSVAVRTNYSVEGNYITSNEIFIYALKPGATETIHYKLVGISSEDLSTNNESVLANAITRLQPKIYSNLFGTLKKAELEDPAYTGRNARLISVEFRNPTDFVYIIDKVEVIKTNINDPNAEIDKWIFTDDKATLTEYENWAFDFVDEDAVEGQIYWLSTDIYIDAITINATANISRFSQEDLILIESNVTLNESFNESISFLSDRLYLRKFASSTLMIPGQEVNITVLVNNLEPEDVDLTVTDPLPQGFDVVRVKDGAVVGENVTWDVSLSSGSGKRLQYTLKYSDEDSLGLDYFKPAHFVYNDKLYYSQSLPFVRQYVPNNKLFVQKSVDFLSGEEVQITLTVKNLGESSLENVMIKEHLLSTAEFREISEAPLERGLWKIDSLAQSGEWETTYITDKMSVLNTVPDVYGIEQASVLQTIILSNLITSKFSLLDTSLVEIVGLVVLALLLLLYFVPPSYFSRKEKVQKNDLALMSRELEQLKKKTRTQKEILVKEKPVLSSPKAPNVAPAQKVSRLQAPERVARHKSLEESAALLEKAKERMEKKEE